MKNDFEQSGIKIDLQLILKQIEIYNNHTFYQQYFFNRLFDYAEKEVTEDNFNTVSELILKERDYVFINYRNLLTKGQYKMLISIAKERRIEQINASQFLRKHNLSQASSVASAAKALIDKEMLYKEDNKYYVYDVFFEKWLQKTY